MQQVHTDTDMRSLQSWCICAVIEHRQHEHITHWMQHIAPALRTRIITAYFEACSTLLLSLSPSAIVHSDAHVVVIEQFQEYGAFLQCLRGLTAVHIGMNECLTDAFVHSIALMCGASLEHLDVCVPCLHVHGHADTSAHSLRHVLANAHALHSLSITWPLTFPAGLLNQVHSVHLRRVRVCADSACRCVHANRMHTKGVDTEYQRDLVFLALHNRTITHLSLEGFILDIHDFQSLLPALGTCLLNLELVLFTGSRRHQCSQEHPQMGGRALVHLLQLLTTHCTQLHSLSLRRQHAWIHSKHNTVFAQHQQLDPDSYVLVSGARSLNLQHFKCLSTLILEGYVLDSSISELHLPDSVHSVTLTLLVSQRNTQHNHRLLEQVCAIGALRELHVHVCTGAQEEVVPMQLPACTHSTLATLRHISPHACSSLCVRSVCNAGVVLHTLDVFVPSAAQLHLFVRVLLHSASRLVLLRLMCLDDDDDTPNEWLSAETHLFTALTNCARLQLLCLRGLRGLSSHNMRALPASVQQLSVDAASTCSSLSAHQVHDIIRTCPTLTHLGFSASCVGDLNVFVVGVANRLRPTFTGQLLLSDIEPDCVCPRVLAYWHRHVDARLIRVP